LGNCDEGCTSLERKVGFLGGGKGEFWETFVPERDSRKGGGKKNLETEGTRVSKKLKGKTQEEKR